MIKDHSDNTFCSYDGFHIVLKHLKLYLPVNYSYLPWVQLSQKFVDQHHNHGNWVPFGIL